MTIDEFRQMPEDGLRHELICGELKTMTRPGSEHGFLMTIISAILWDYVRKNKLGVVISGDAGFILSREDTTVVGPDIAFVPTAQVPPTGVPKKWLDAAPALAIEIISPNDTIQEVDEKVDLYLNAGTKLVWLVTPTRRTVTIHSAGHEIRVLRPTDTIDGEGVLPGFRCEVRQFFEA